MEVGKYSLVIKKKNGTWKRKGSFIFIFFFKKEEVIFVLTNMREKCESERKKFYLFIFNLAKI